MDAINVEPIADTQAIKTQLDTLLEERHRFFPRKSEANGRALAQQFSQYQAQLQQAQQAIVPDPSLVQQAEAIVDNPIFVCGHAKSGTSLMVNLLDGHPDLITMPGDSHAVYVAKTYGGNTTDAIDPKGDEWSLYWLSRLINPTGQKPFWLLGKEDQNYLAFLSYLHFWRQQLGTHTAMPFLAAVLAYFCANPRRPTSPVAWIAKTPANEYRIDELLTQYPTARFIHVLRNPFTNLVSMKRLSTYRSGQAYTLRSAYRIRRSLQQGANNQKRLGEERYHFVLYKDIVNNPQVTMQQVAAYLDVPFHDRLLTPTVNGFAATANSMQRAHTHRGAVHNNNVRWSAELTLLERSISQLLFWGWQRPFHLY